MASDSNITCKGKIIECLRGTLFKVVLLDDNDNETNKECLCSLGGKLRMYQINIAAGDIVELKVSPYDLGKGIITYRFK